MLEDLRNDLLEVSAAQAAVDEDMRINVDVDDFDALSGQTLPIPTADGGATLSSTTADGGPTDRASLSEVATKSMQAFGEAFDESALINNADRIRAPTQLLDGRPSDFIDETAIIDVLSDVESPISVETLRGLDANGSRAIRSFAELDREGVTSLPVQRGRLSQIFPDLSDSWQSVTESFENFDASTINNLYASFVPLMVTFVGALPAAIAGLGALAASAFAVAGALGAVGALGALGVVIAEDQSLEDVAEDLRTSFKEAFGPIAEALRPTFLEAVDSVELFLEELGQRASALRLFSEDLLDALDAVEAFAIGGIQNLIKLAQIAQPLISNLFSQFGDISITQILAGILADTVGMLRVLGGMIVNLLPTIYRLSKGFLVVATGVLGLLSVWGSLLNQIPLGTELLGVLIATLLVLTSVITLAIAVEKLWNAALVETAVKAISTYIGSLSSLITSKFAYIATTYGATAATLAFAAAAAVAISVVTLGIGAVAGLAGGFSILGGEIGQATRQLKKFSNQQGRLDSVGGEIGSGGTNNGYVNYTDQSQTTIEAPDPQTGSAVAEQYSYRNEKMSQHTV